MYRKYYCFVEFYNNALRARGDKVSVLQVEHIYHVFRACRGKNGCMHLAFLSRTKVPFGGRYPGLKDEIVTGKFVTTIVRT